VLQEREVQRLGATDAIRIDVRIIAATLHPLEDLVQEGSFREDLFYRLNVLRVEIPPLRARSKDISILARHFLSKSLNLSESSIDLDLLLEVLSPYLQRYHWPGNIRELENLLERIAVLAPTVQSNSSINSNWILQVAPEFGRPKRERDAADYEAIVKKYGSIATAAKMLNISRTTLWRRLRDGTD
jgi:propionate catabolism operon transcriptional regulator